ncbi:hypothetical protein BH11PSE9_BH11PSE9_19070 [soil metagenome]
MSRIPSKLAKANREMNMRFRHTPITAPKLNPARFSLPLVDMMLGEQADASTRTGWLLRCEAKLQELRPGQDRDAIAALARDMWPDVQRFSPEIAAEMEHESSWVEQ